MTNNRIIEADSIHNLRTLGGYDAGRSVTSARFIRGASLEETNDKDASELIRHGVRTVIDLRNSVETAKIPSVFSKRSEVRYLNIPLMPERTDAEREKSIPESFTMGQMYIDFLKNFRPAIRLIFEAMAESEGGASIARRARIAPG
jgi:hypothetical protein